jgi:hypothetical protein
MSLWDNPQPISQELSALLDGIKVLSPEEFKAAWKARLVTHCEHGTERTKHCAWCYIKTAAYRQTLVDAMRIVLD